MWEICCLDLVRLLALELVPSLFVLSLRAGTFLLAQRAFRISWARRLRSSNFLFMKTALYDRVWRKLKLSSKTPSPTDQPTADFWSGRFQSTSSSL
jgi:hypothetical protein